MHSTSRRPVFVSDDSSVDQPTSMLINTSSVDKKYKVESLFKDFAGAECTEQQCVPCLPSVTIKDQGLHANSVYAKLKAPSNATYKIKEVKVDVAEGEELLILSSGGSYARRYTSSGNDNIRPYAIPYIYKDLEGADNVEQLHGYEFANDKVVLLFNGEPASKTKRDSKISNFFSVSGNNNTLSVKDKFRQALIGLNNIHHKGYIHTFINDLTVLMTDSKVEIQRLDKAIKPLTGTYTSGNDLPANHVFTSPEAFNRDMPVSTKSDVYSLGIVFMNYILGGDCIHNIRTSAKEYVSGDEVPIKWFVLIQNMADKFKSRSLNKYAEYGFDVEGLIADMINVNEAERLSAKKLLKRYFDGEYTPAGKCYVTKHFSKNREDSRARIYEVCPSPIIRMDVPVMMQVNQLVEKLEKNLQLSSSEVASIYADHDIASFLVSMSVFLYHQHRSSSDKFCPLKKNSDLMAKLFDALTR